MLETLITSKTRIKLLLKFFLNSENSAYLRSLETEFGESTNAIRQELNRLEDAGMLQSEKRGNRRYFRANIRHPLFYEVQSIVKKFVGIDQITERIAKRVGNLEKIYVEGRLAKGLEAEVIDIVLMGEDIDRQYLTKLIEKAETIIGKHIRYVIIEPGEEEKYMEKQKVKPLLIWNK